MVVVGVDGRAWAAPTAFERAGCLRKKWGNCGARERSSKPGLLPHPACYATASLAAFTGRALMIFRAGLRLEGRRLLGERIDALAAPLWQAFYDGEFGKPWHDESAGLLELFMADFGNRLSGYRPAWGRARFSDSDLAADFDNLIAWQVKIICHMGGIALMRTNSFSCQPGRPLPSWRRVTVWCPTKYVTSARSIVQPRSLS